MNSARLYLSALITRPTKDLRLGHRFLADNPLLTPDQAAPPEIDPQFWRQVRLRMAKPGGGTVNIELLRPVGWQLQQAQVDFDTSLHIVLVGRTIDLDLAEMGAAGPAVITSVRPCPQIEAAGEGRQLITGLFRHSAGNVGDLYLDGQSKPIGTTDNHPFWSDDRREFVRADALRPGERLPTATGSTRTVSRLVPHATAEIVYNLEVDGEHIYYVSASGVLVHNQYHGYAIINEATGEILKLGVSRRGFRASGQSIRAREQLTKLATQFGVDRGDLNTVVL